MKDPRAAGIHAHTESTPSSRRPAPDSAWSVDAARPSAPTLLDVALAAGVSISTASRVLNGSTRKVAGSYRARVEEAAALLGYTANILAQATARGSSAIIALLVADIADPYFGQIAAGVARGADEAGYVVTIAMTERSAQREHRLVRALRGQKPKALILAASRVEKSMPDVHRELDVFAQAGGRVVILGPGAGHARSVLIDNFGGASALGSQLARGGYRRAIVLAAEEGVLTSEDRIAGFREGFIQAGGCVERVYHDGFTRDSGARLMSQVLRNGIDAGTLIFAVSDVVAIGAMSAIRDAGRAIGSDLALCGFDDIPAGMDVTPHLTTVKVPLEDFGYLALRAAIAESWEANGSALPVEVLIRESTPLRNAAGREEEHA